MVGLSDYEGTEIAKSFKGSNDEVIMKGGKGGHLIPKKITDKTGKQTTVWVNPDQVAHAMKTAQEVHGSEWSDKHKDTYHDVLQGHHDKNKTVSEKAAGDVAHPEDKAEAEKETKGEQKTITAADKGKEKMAKESKKSRKSTAPPDITARGYEDIVKNFWGLEDDVASGDVKIPENEWKTKPVVFVDSDELDEGIDHELMKQHHGENEKEKTVKIKGKEFKVFTIAGDGGFQAFLFDAADYKELIKLDSSLEFVGVDLGFKEEGGGEKSAKKEAKKSQQNGDYEETMKSLTGGYSK